MRKIDLEEGSPWITVASMGSPRSGKTTFAATFPRPIILADASERGWTSIKNMNPDEFYEPGRPPEVIAIEDAADMLAQLTSIQERIAKDPTCIYTVVVDSLTFYADAYLSKLKTSAGAKDNGWEVYGKLGDHLSWLANAFQRIQRNIVWTMLDKKDEQGRTVGITIPGQAGIKFLARVDYQLFHRATKQLDSKDKLPVFEVRTRTFDGFTFGGRDGGRLPDPLPTPTYRALAEALGLPDPLASSKPKVAPAPVAVRKPAVPQAVVRPGMR